MHSHWVHIVLSSLSSHLFQDILVLRFLACSHFSGQFSVSVPDCILCVPLPLHQSCGQQWAAQSQRSEWGSNQSHYHHCWCCRPEGGQRAHQLPHRSSQPRPEPGPLGDSQPLCVISTLALPRGCWREKDAGRQREREGGHRERKKSTQRPRDLLVTCEQWSVPQKALLLLAGCLLLSPLTGQVVPVGAGPVNDK